MEAVISHHRAPVIKVGYKYQITREGYDEITWEPAINLSYPLQMLDEYKTQHGLGEMKVKQKRKG